MKTFSLRAVLCGAAVLAAVAFVPVAGATPVQVYGSFTTTGKGTLQLASGTYTLGYSTHNTTTTNRHNDQTNGTWIASDSVGYFASTFSAAANPWYTTGATQVNANGPNKFVTGRTPAAYTFTAAGEGSTLTPATPFEQVTEGNYEMDFFITEIDTGSPVLSKATTHSGHPPVTVLGNGYVFTGLGYVNVYLNGVLVGTNTGSFSLASDTPAATTTNEPFQLTFTAVSPEPSSLLLLGTGLLGMALLMRRKFASSSLF